MVCSEYDPSPCQRQILRQAGKLLFHGFLFHLHQNQIPFLCRTVFRQRKKTGAVFLKTDKRRADILLPVFDPADVNISQYGNPVCRSDPYFGRFLVLQIEADKSRPVPDRHAGKYKRIRQSLPPVLPAEPDGRLRRFLCRRKARSGESGSYIPEARRNHRMQAPP